MAFASIATALRAWTAALRLDCPAGESRAGRLVRAYGIRDRPVETRLDYAALALRRAFFNDRRGADADATAREFLSQEPRPLAAGPAAASAVISETSAPNTDMIIAVTRDAMAAALREAFDDGRADKARELKAMMAALLDDLLSPEKRRVVRTVPRHVVQ